LKGYLGKPVAKEMERERLGSSPGRLQVDIKLKSSSKHIKVLREAENV